MSHLLLSLFFIFSNILFGSQHAHGKQTSYACEGSMLELECEPGRVIHLIRAIYGRFSITICNENGNTEWSVNCGSPKSILVLNGTCNYQRSCNVLASTNTFGDPCPGTVKYLEVQYQCISELSLLTSTTPKSIPQAPWPSRSPLPPEEEEFKPEEEEELVPEDKFMPEEEFKSEEGRGRSTVISTTSTSTTSTPPHYVPEEEEEEGGGGGSNYRDMFQHQTGLNMGVKWGEERSGSEVTVRTPLFNAHEERTTTTERVTEGGRSSGGNEFCASKLERGMFWNWTGVGSVVRQPCPGGASGLAKWKCGESGSWWPDSPDLSDCKSAWLGSLQARVLESDQIPTVLAGELAQVTSTKQMYGGDIGAAVRVMKTLASRKNEELRSLSSQVSREDLAAELLQLILEAGSNLLDKGKLEPWRDLSYAHKMANATGLLVGLEDNAFLLANVISYEKTLRKYSKNILTTIYVIEASNVREINFPSSDSPDHWALLGDVLSMPPEALRENSDGGLVRLVCFAYNNLEHVLQPVDDDEESVGSKKVQKLVNSRVISASLNQGRHIQLALPVHLTLRHLWLDNVSNPQCVFWDYTLNAWSEEGCRVVKSNRTHTECQCTHLTNFAILMDLAPPPKHLSTPQLAQVIMYVGSAVVILCLVFTLIITHFCIHGKVFQTMILKNLFLSMLIVEIIFVFGVQETGRAWVCTSIALIEHYFALSSFLWLFLHGFHLHLIVVEAAESGLSRQLWYYGVSYGSPGIVVLLSFLLDPLGYRSSSYCWITPSFSLLSFVGPALLVAIGTGGVLVYTSVQVSGLLSALPKKPNDDKALYNYARTWIRGSMLILFLMTVSWTLRLLHLNSYSSPSLSYGANIAIGIQGISILVFHLLKSEDMLTKLCDCGGSGESSETEMSTHSAQQSSGGSSSHQPSSANLDPSLHPPHSSTLSRTHHPPDPRALDTLYAKQLLHSQSALNGPRYSDGMIGMYGRGSSYSDIRNMSYHHHRGGGGDPVYEEIEKPHSPRASVSDLSDDEINIYPQDLLYARTLYSSQLQNRATLSHYHPNPHPHRHPHLHPTNSSTGARHSHNNTKGEAENPLLTHTTPRSFALQPQLPPIAPNYHYLRQQRGINMGGTTHSTPEHHNNVHMV